jgi:hypothetical protein
MGLAVNLVEHLARGDWHWAVDEWIIAFIYKPKLIITMEI